MSEYEKFYKENLYPFQDGILAIVKRINVPFYLTGGTALSRYYCPHRYSDDLDLFVNDLSDFTNWVDLLYTELEKESKQGGFSILTDKVQKYKDYVQLFVKHQQSDDRAIVLKIDLVNDVAPHYGKLEWDATLGSVDSWRNILSNKIAALYRVEAKDMVDLWSLSKLKVFNWAEIVREASSKEAGIDPLVLFDLLNSFPKKELESIKWIKPEPSHQLIMKDLGIMAKDIFEGRQNSLAGKSANQ